MRIDVFEIFAFWRDYGKSLYALPIQYHIHFMRFVQSLDLFIPIAHETNLNLVIAVARKRVGKQCSAAGPEGQAFDVLFLGKIRPEPKSLTARCSRGSAKREPADLVCRSDVPIQERRRKVCDGNVVEALAYVIFRQ